jgi:hypothetical protein
VLKELGAARELGQAQAKNRRVLACGDESSVEGRDRRRVRRADQADRRWDAVKRNKPGGLDTVRGSADVVAWFVRGRLGGRSWVPDRWLSQHQGPKVLPGEVGSRNSKCYKHREAGGASSLCVTTANQLGKAVALPHDSEATYLGSAQQRHLLQPAQADAR